MDIKELRRAVDASGARQPGRRFSRELKEKLVATIQQLRSSGEKVVDIAEALGVNASTVARYLKEESGGGDGAEGPVARPEGGLVPVEITGRRARRSGVQVTTPDGFVVDGLDIEEAVKAIRALR